MCLARVDHRGGKRGFGTDGAVTGLGGRAMEKKEGDERRSRSGCDGRPACRRRVSRGKGKGVSSLAYARIVLRFVFRTDHGVRIRDYDRYDSGLESHVKKEMRGSMLSIARLYPPLSMPHLHRIGPVACSIKKGKNTKNSCRAFFFLFLALSKYLSARIDIAQQRRRVREKTSSCGYILQGTPSLV